MQCLDGLKSRVLSLCAGRAKVAELEARVVELERKLGIEQATANGCGLGVSIVPDLVQVHSAISRAADGVKRFSDLQHLPFSRSDGGRKYMFNLMPVWNWQTATGPPRAEEFWRLAHAVARDQDRDDWVAPHVTLHSRSDDLNALAEKFMKLLAGFGQAAWKELMFTLRTVSNWKLGEDTRAAQPSTADHFVLHKAKIDLPESFRRWLDENQHADILQPRKQDRGGKDPRENGTFPIREMFHISLYSFRVARSEDQPAKSRSKTFRSTSYAEIDLQAASHEIPSEKNLRADLARADWMLVLLSPGWTGTPALSPQVLAAVRLSDLASGALSQ